MPSNDDLREILLILRELVLHLATTEETKLQLHARINALAGDEPVDEQPAAEVDPKDARIRELEEQLAAARGDGEPSDETKKPASGRAKAGAAS